jgi:hypothetical protein
LVHETDSLSSRLPVYVLLEGNEKTGPKMLATKSGIEYRAIYGFSDKPFYDRFSAQSDKALTPYPLVQGYLRGQIEEAGDVIMLVALDALSPDDEVLRAVTMSAVLDACASQQDHVSGSCRLIRNAQSRSYQVAPQ